MRLAVALALTAAAAAAPAGERVDLAAAVKRARSYFSAWKPSLAAVVAEERYTQTLHQLPFGRHVVTSRNRTTTRQLLSDVLLVRSGDAWLMFRDVMMVDGEAVRDRAQRFDALFRTADMNLLPMARRIADEGARYNLGQMYRNLNTPATPLVFLEDAYASSVRWRGASEVRIDGSPAIELAFEQKRAPFAIRSVDGEPQPASGSIWTDPASGRILQTRLVVEGRLTIANVRGQPVPARAVATVVAKFGAVPGLDTWVPLSMADGYEATARAEERLEGVATYTNHRLFQTSARIVGGRR